MKLSLQFPDRRRHRASHCGGVIIACSQAAGAGGFIATIIRVPGTQEPRCNNIWQLLGRSVSELVVIRRRFTAREKVAMQHNDQSWVFARRCTPVNLRLDPQAIRRAVIQPSIFGPETVYTREHKGPEKETLACSSDSTHS